MTVSKFQKFETRRVHRRSLQAAPYNPRTIDDYAKRKLANKLKKRGLLAALVWNEKTGNVVSGHQRLAILDVLEGSDDYELDVNVVRLTPKQEKEENIFFNNQSAMGDWDLTKLHEIVGGGEVTFDELGFEKLDIEMAMAEAGLPSLFSADTQSAASQQVMSEVAALDAKLTETNGRMANGEAIRDPARLAEMKAERETIRAKAAAQNDANDTEFYAVVICGCREDREALMAALGHRRDEKYIDVRRLFHKLGVEPPKTEAA